MEMTKYEGKIWFFMFGYVLIDSLGSYFLWKKIGFPHNSLLIMVMMVALMVWGVKKTLPPMEQIINIGMIFFGFLIGVLINKDAGLGVVFKLGTALIAFTVGYTACRWTTDSEKYIKLFLIVGSCYVVTCLVALLKLYPALFPMIYSTGFRASGQMVIRPEITTDQNFQIFYLFFIPAIFILKFKFKYFLVATLLVLLSLYILVGLQTRSGLLIMIGVLTIVLVIAPVINKKYGRYKLVLFPIILVLVSIVFYDKIIDVSGPLLERFQSKEVKTLEGRMFSATYLFENIFNPLYWLPHGNEEFVKQMGDVPHFTPTAMYLEGGLFGLIGWILLFMVPLYKMGILFIKNKLDHLASLIMVCGLASMMAQLSLNAPLYDHVWLWGGAIVGTLYRIKFTKVAQIDNNLYSQKEELNELTTYVGLRK